MQIFRFVLDGNMIGITQDSSKGLRSLYALRRDDMGFMSDVRLGTLCSA